MTKEQEKLLEEAKRRYLPETVFNLAHLGYSEKGIIPKVPFYKIDSDINIYITDNKGNVLNNDKCYSLCIYHKGKWGTIIESPKPQFEVGKWYLYKHPNSDNYLRCNKQSNDGTIYYSDYIEVKSKLHGYNDSFMNNSYVTNQEVPLSEVQQYLPDGHPDKYPDKPKEKVMDKIEVFPGIYVGDIVVSLKLRPDIRKDGDILKVLERSYKGMLYYNSNTCSGTPSEWRKATKEEEEAYSKGIRNISEIKTMITSLEKDKYYVISWCNNRTYIVKYRGKSTDINIDLKDNTYSTHGKFDVPTNWVSVRFATKDEIDWLNRCIHAGKFVPKEDYTHQVVHCKTQEEWDFVAKKLGYDNFNYWGMYKQHSCISLNDRGYADTHGPAYGNGKALIYSFDEWCTKFGHKMEAKIPEYVECISSNDAAQNWTIGKVYRTEATGILSNNGYNYKKSSYNDFIEYISGWGVRFKPSTKEAFDKQNPSNLVCGVNLIPGEVYYFTSGSNWLLKFEGIEDNHFIGASVALPRTNSIGMWYRSQKWGSVSAIKDLRLATPEEKAHFEACEKAGKYVEAPKKEENITFEVKIINSKSGNWYKIGEEYTIYASQSKPDGLVYFNHPTDRTYWISASNCEIIRNYQWIPKVGDWAKCIGVGGKGSGAGWKKDRVFQITEITPSIDGDILWGEGGTKTGPGGVYLKGDHIRKAEPHEISDMDKGDITITFKDGLNGPCKGSIGGKGIYKAEEVLKHPWPVGTRVKINPDSDFARCGQSKGGGGVISEYNKGLEFLYRVKWDKDAENSYREQDLLLEMVDFSEKCSTKPTDAQVSREVSVDLYIPKGSDTLDTKVTRSRPVTIDLKQESKVLLF